MKQKHIIGQDFDVYLNKPAEASASVSNLDEIEKNMLEMTGNNTYTVNMFLDERIYENHQELAGIFKVKDHRNRIWDVVMKVFKNTKDVNLIYGLKVVGGNDNV